MLAGVGLVCVLVCVCLSTGQSESTEATGARCDDRRSLGLKIVFCSQHRETEERREGGGVNRGEEVLGGGGKVNKGEMEGGMERKARSLRITCQISLGKVSSPPNGTTGSFSMKSLICWSSPWRNREGSDGEGGRWGERTGQGGAERSG